MEDLSFNPLQVQTKLSKALPLYRVGTLRFNPLQVQTKPIPYKWLMVEVLEFQSPIGTNKTYQCTRNEDGKNGFNPLQVQTKPKSEKEVAMAVICFNPLQVQTKHIGACKGGK